MYWHEGEDYQEGPTNPVEGIAEKAPASGGKSLVGRALNEKGERVAYEFTLARCIPDARLLLRYSRHHWKPMPPARLDVTLALGTQRISGSAVLGNTGGWGTDDKAQWKLAAVDVGTLAAGRWRLTLSSASEERGDVCIDGFFLAPDSIEIGEHELAADRIHINSERYVGVILYPKVFRQDGFEGFELAARGFVPATAGVKVTLLDSNGRRVALLHEADSIPLRAEPLRIPVSGKPFGGLPDGDYTVRTEWQSAPLFEVQVQLVGVLAADFERRLARIAEFHARRKDATPPDEHVTDYEHAIEYLSAGWQSIKAGRTAPGLVENLRRTLGQYEQASDRLSAGEVPFAGMRADLRFAFRSRATGKLEPYRIFLPDSYRDDGSTPCILVLNHNEDNFLDQAGGVTKRVANERGYAMISPRASSNYWGRGQKDLVQVAELVLRDYPGLDRRRLYCTGASRGAFGTYGLATAHPKMLAAIACAAGVGNWRLVKAPPEGLIERYTPVPTLILQGELDGQVPAETAVRVAEQLKRRGIAHELHVFPSHTHAYRPYAEQYLTMSLDYFDRYRLEE